MENREKWAGPNIVVRTTYPVTIPGYSELYQETYSNLSLRVALSLVESKIRTGYRVDLYFSGDEEVFFDINSEWWLL